MARDYDLFVIINLQHDSADDIKNRWLDIDADRATMEQIRNIYQEIWHRLANTFKDYDQHLIFESMNEVMEEGNYGTPTASTWENINTLNQMFVDVVRSVTGNESRFLMVPGYYNLIDQTVSDNFVMPRYDRDYQYEMVVVHVFDPYNFTLDEGVGSRTEVTIDDLKYLDTQLEKMHRKFVENGIPVVVGEFGAIDKDNLPDIKKYVRGFVNAAKVNDIGYLYWDNGYDGKYGLALWNRYTYMPTTLGKMLIPILTDKSI